MRNEVIFFINGAEHRARGDAVFQTVSRYLRYDQRATGTKIVCEEGDCGACTVLVGRPEGGGLRYRPVNSCIQFLFQVDGTHVVTVEGLSKNGLTPLQDAMVRCHGAQCGYCTPGFIMAMAAMWEGARGSGLGAREVSAALTGNLCRCTGYEPIIMAALEVEGQPRIDEMFPPDPILRALPDGEGVRVGSFFKPATLEEAIEFKAAHPKCVIVQGATDFGVWCNKRGFVPEAVLSLDAIEGLDEVRIEDGELIAGGRTTLAAIEELVAGKMPELERILDRFGSPQIKNVGTLAGNIANASPIADTLPFLYVTGARLELTGRGGTRSVPIESFYRGYKTLDLRPDEIITRIRVPLPPRSDTLRLYKVSKRSHLDISSFTAAMLMRRSGDRIESIRIAYGGVAPVILRLPKTEQFLAGRPFALETFEQAAPIARDEITPISDVRGSRDFRLQLAGNVLRKFFHDAG
ncbi:MAG TPA: FAD binding domain-containing protein [Thermoanaerobaculia bacterium]|nr:FAD binding domain-containing protein [Thermoanaerobaculia bacterium]